MATAISVFVLVVLAIGTAMLCRCAGNTRRRTESVVATETYQIRDQDTYRIEYRHCVTTGTYNIHALVYPANPHSSELSKCGIAGDGQVWAAKPPRSFEQAEAVASAWMESYSNYIRSGASAKRPVSRPNWLKISKSKRHKRLCGQDLSG